MTHTQHAAIAIERTLAGQQLVLPGAEKASDRVMARRAADTPLRPRIAQRPCDYGLFGDAMMQSDLIDILRRGE